jgi:PKD repeat protein
MLRQSDMFPQKIIVTFLFVLAAMAAGAQCLTYPVSFSSRAASASVIVEGKVLSQNSFWNANHDFIYTANEIQVYKIFKGTVSTSNIFVITEGGIVGDNMIVVEPSLTFSLDDRGIIFLQATSVSNPFANYAAGSVFEPYASRQGFVKYDLTDLTAHDDYNTYTNVPVQLYQPLVALTGQPFVSLAPFNINDYGSSESRATPVITSVSPNPTTAGTLAASTITINGSNFGPGFSGSAKLEFPDANTGGASYVITPANHIVSWSDVQIVAKVVTGAGSGAFRITNTTNETATSPFSLTINYNETNVVSSGSYIQPDLVNRNGTGGYVFQYNTTFNANAPAVAAFERAMQTWRCGTFVNFSHNGTTAIATQALDNVNVVTFDGSSALPAGVLGTSYSYYSSCGGGVWYLNENDCKWRTNGTGGINWNYGPVATSGGLYDFESVCVHELGHSHQLGHTILAPPSVMHWSIGANTDRRGLVATSELAGGNDIMSRSVVSNSCGPTAMIALTASNCNINAPVANFSGTPTSGCNNITVNFTDLSTGSPTSWSWSFPGGTPATSTLQNPSVNYSAPGTYNVSLTSTNAQGSDTRTLTSYITVNSCPPPAANFYGTPTTLCSGQTVSYFDISTNTPTSWSWSFPGGTPATSTLQNPVVTYSVVGTYGATLTATNAYGSNTFTQNNYITVNNCPPPPVANFTGSPTTVCTGGTVTYTDLSTNSPTAWNWSFPGGTPSTSVIQNPTVTYSSPGVYNVTLTATNSGGSNTFVRPNYITVNTCAAPVASFSGWPTTICAGQSVNFTDLSSNAPTSWNWTFPGGTPASSTAQNPVVTYAAGGTYTVTLSATNGFGTNTSTATNYITVSNCPPTGVGLIVNDGSLIHVQSGGLITVQGGFINQDNGANIGNIDNSGLITLTGDWTNTSVSNAFINSSPGETQFLGAAQLITGTIPTYFYNLTLLGTGIKTMTLDARTLGTLALNDRELSTQTYVMWVTNAAVGAVTRTGGFNSIPVQGFVSSTGAGRLWRNTNSTGTYLFPVGSSVVNPRYRPVEIIPASSAAHTFGVQFVNHNPNIDGFNTSNKDVNLGVINSLWYQKINRVTGTANADITLYFDNVNDGVAAVPNVRLTEWGFAVSPIQWRDMGTVTPVAAGSPALSKATKVSWNNFATENFNIAPQSVPLPVELVTFSAVCTANGIDVEWTTASEFNNSHFVIERSTDAIHTEYITTIPGSGNSNILVNYSFTDRFTPSSTVYYFLTQFDYDGNSTRYGPVAVNCNLSNEVAGVFPNPFSSDVFVYLNLADNGNVIFSLTNALGQTVKVFSRELKKGSHQLLMDWSDVAPGLYHLNVRTVSSNLSVKLIKEK